MLSTGTGTKENPPNSIGEGASSEPKNRIRDASIALAVDASLKRSSPRGLMAAAMPNPNKPNPDDRHIHKLR